MMVKHVRSILVLLLLMTGCNKNDNGTGPAAANVAGTWRATVTASTCTPSDVCSSVGFSGGTAIGIMILSQDGNKVNGSYTYEGAGVTASISGNVSGNNLVVDGSATNPLGKVTVHLTGTVNQNVLPSNVSHQVNLVDGRSGTITGSGDFHRQ